MIHPIVVYGNPILREKTVEIPEDSEELQTLILDMFETMKEASGVGLAAPQIGRSERMFVVSLAAIREADEDSPVPFPDKNNLAIINPRLELLESEKIDFEEGCLSLPDIREFVTRPDSVRIQFLDQDFQTQDLELTDMMARVFQHEFDHLEGVLFLDRISTFRRKLLKRRLKDMSLGFVEASYPLLINGEVV